MKHIGAYKPLECTEGWLKCKVCCVYPRVWMFDNGMHATCLCYRMYDTHPARSESIMSVHKRCEGNISEYKRDNLRLAWNKFVETGEEQNKLEVRRW